MDTVVQRCAGLDIGKADLKACVRIPGKSRRRTQEIRTSATTTPWLLMLREHNSTKVLPVGELDGRFWALSWPGFVSD